MRLRRWFCHRFLTRVEPAMHNRNAGRIVSTDEEPFDFVPGVEVSRPDWWCLGGRSGVTDATYEQARQRLDEWQDDMAGRSA